MGILLSREFYLGYFLPILYSILLERWLEAREFVRFTIFLFLFKQRSRWISYLAICRLGSLEILELLHSFVGSTFCQLEFMRLSFSLSLLWRGIQGILIEYFYSFFLLFFLRLVYFWTQKRASLLSLIGEWKKKGKDSFRIFFWFFDSFSDVPRYDSLSFHSLRIYPYKNLRNFWLFLVLFSFLASIWSWESRRIKSSQLLLVSKVRYSVILISNLWPILWYTRYIHVSVQFVCKMI